MAATVPQPKIFACQKSKVLADAIAKAFGQPLGNVITSTYSDGEFQPSFEESVRGSRVFIIGSTMPNSCLLYTSPSPRDLSTSRMPSSA